MTITKNGILDIEYIDDKAIEDAKVDEALHEFLSNYKGYYWIKAKLYDESKYCAKEAEPFLLTEDEFEKIIVAEL